MSAKPQKGNNAKAKVLKRIRLIDARVIPDGSKSVVTYDPIIRRNVRIKNGQFIAKMLHPEIGAQDVENAVKEGDVVYVLQLVDKLNTTLKDIREDSRKESRTHGGGGGNTPGNIFHRLIDEDKMSDCILHIKDSFFNAGKECEICAVKFNLYDFFMFVHLYFCYIGIMDKAISQLAYCTYLNKKVFGGNNIVNVRNFNIYSQKDVYKNFADLLTDKKDIRFNSRPQMPRSATENFLLAPFQEIGWKFQHSDYFDELRREIKKAQSFVL